jgi:diguanylate cyclase (GGDEF)-like protein
VAALNLGPGAHEGPALCPDVSREGANGSQRADAAKNMAAKGLRSGDFAAIYCLFRFGPVVAYRPFRGKSAMATNVPSFFSPATIARAYGRVSLTATPARASADTLPPDHIGPRRILVVDSDTEIADRVVRVLRTDGLEVSCCTPSEDLLSCVLSTRPDVVLIHTRAGDQQALVACCQLQQFDSARTRTVIAYTTGDAKEDVVVHALHSGADDCIADVGRDRELRARVSAQLRHLRDREVMRWARDQRSSLRDLANTDPLTGVANRRAIQRLLDFTLGTGKGVAFVLVDLDHFKRINDTFGHPAGDVVLRRVARSLHKATPLGGVAARWGGEEFAIVVPASDGVGLSLENAASIGERFREAVAGTSLGDIEGSPRITASVGVAAWSAAGAPQSSGRLIAIADAALYQSKNQGRDCVSTSLVPAE